MTTYLRRPEVIQVSTRSTNRWKLFSSIFRVARAGQPDVKWAAAETAERAHLLVVLDTATTSQVAKAPIVALTTSC